MTFYDRAKIENGILEIELNNWMEFVEFSSYFLDNPGVYFRGQRDSSWKLTTTLDRLAATLDQRVQGAYDTILDFFIKATRGRTLIDRDNEDKLWALGQHNGFSHPFT